MQASELSQRIKKHSASLTRAALSTCGRAQKQIPISSEAIELVPVSAEEWFHVPSSMAEWEEMRLKNMAAEK
jgi:hypothetical protein